MGATEIIALVASAISAALSIGMNIAFSAVTKKEKRRQRELQQERRRKNDRADTKEYFKVINSSSNGEEADPMEFRNKSNHEGFNYITS